MPELQRFGFMGIHLIRPEIFDWMEEEGKFSITDVYLRLAKAHRIDAQDCSHFQWMDVGSVEQLAKAEDVLMR